MYSDRFSQNIRNFIAEALPHSHWGERYFDIRLMELTLANSLFGNAFSCRQRGSLLDIGCGIGLSSVYFADFFDVVDGTDINEIGVAFRVNKPAPKAGQEIINQLGLKRISLHCGDTLEFLASRYEKYDFIFSCFTLEHIEDLQSISDAMFRAMRSGSRMLHIVPNTHDTIIQLLQRNLEPIRQNLHSAWKNRLNTSRCDGRLEGTMFTPITHSEFVSNYKDQFEVNSTEHYLFPMLHSGFEILDIKPLREHAYGIFAQKL